MIREGQRYRTRSELPVFTILIWIYRGFYLCVSLKDIEEGCELLAERP